MTSLDLEPGKAGASPELLRGTLAALRDAQADRFDPVRFRLIQALADKAIGQRPAVAGALAGKAQQALSGYLDAYGAARDRASAEINRLTASQPDAVPEQGKLSPLAALTQDLARRRGGLGSRSALEEELWRQEQEIQDRVPGTDAWDQTQVHEFRESLLQRQSERRMARALRDGPDSPGPLNSQALIIKSLALMQALSPAYAHRFVAYMDSLLVLGEEVQVTAPAKPKGGRRKS